MGEHNILLPSRLENACLLLLKPTLKFMNDILSPLHPALLSLLATCGISHTKTLTDIVQETQKTWLLPRDRTLPEGSTYPRTKIKDIYKYLEILSFVREQQALNISYQYTIIPGGETKTLQTRIDYLIHCMKRISSTRIVFHCGTHLLPEYDISWQLPLGESPTEVAVSRYLYKYMVPATLKKIPVEFVAIPVREKEIRPNTADGVIMWLAAAPPPGSCLVISNQPYIRYQDAVFRTYLPQTYSVETVGPPLERDSTPISEILDYIARYLYQEYQKRQCIITY